MGGTVKLLGSEGWRVGVIVRGYNSRKISWDAKGWCYYENDKRIRNNLVGAVMNDRKRLKGFTSKPSQGDEVTMEVEDCVLTFKLNGVEIRRVLKSGKALPKVRLPEGRRWRWPC